MRWKVNAKEQEESGHCIFGGSLCGNPHRLPQNCSTGWLLSAALLARTETGSDRHSLPVEGWGEEVWHIPRRMSVPPCSNSPSTETGAEEASGHAVTPAKARCGPAAAFVLKTVTTCSRLKTWYGRQGQQGGGLSVCCRHNDHMLYVEKVTR